MRVYQQIYNSFLELAEATAASTAKRRFGYERSRVLTTKGQLLLIHKNILHCKNRQAPLTPSILRHAEIMHVNPTSILARPTIEIRREVTRLRNDLWTTQKLSAEAQMEWLTQIAQDRSQAEGNPDWETKMKQMLKDAQERAMNRKTENSPLPQKGYTDLSTLSKSQPMTGSYPHNRTNSTSTNTVTSKHTQQTPHY